HSVVGCMVIRAGAGVKKVVGGFFRRLRRSVVAVHHATPQAAEQKRLTAPSRRTRPPRGAPGGAPQAPGQSPPTPPAPRECPCGAARCPCRVWPEPPPPRRGPLRRARRSPCAAPAAP